MARTRRRLSFLPLSPGDRVVDASVRARDLLLPIRYRGPRVARPLRADTVNVQASDVASVVAPVGIGLLYIALCSLVPEPARQRLNAVVVAGAGAAYISGGAFGLWELAFTAVVTFCAFRGLQNYTWLGVGWLLHTGWDVLHHRHGAPIIPELAHSSFGCAICDPVLAIWMFMRAPSIFPKLSARLARRQPRTVAGSEEEPANGPPDTTVPR